MYVLLDTNIIASDFMLKGNQFKDLFDYLSSTDNTLIIPEIVFNESIRKYNNTYEGIYRKLKRSINYDLNRLGSKNVNTVSDFKKIMEKEIKEYPKYLENMLLENRWERIKKKKIESEKLIFDYLQKNKPFNENGYGIADWLVWDIVELCICSYGETAFISHNTKDFADKNGDLNCLLKEKANNFPFKLLYFTSIQDFLSFVLPKYENINLEWLQERQINEEIIMELLNDVTEFGEDILNNLEAEYDEPCDLIFNEITCNPKSFYTKKIDEKTFVLSVEYEGEAHFSFDYYDPLYYALNKEYTEGLGTQKYHADIVYKVNYDKIIIENKGRIILDDIDVY